MFRLIQKVLEQKNGHSQQLCVVIQECGFELVQHSPCSPDLALLDYLFPKMKLSGHHFDGDDEVITAVYHFL